MMKMTKLTRMILLCTALILLCLLLSSCSHRHIEVVYKGVEPTCTSTGYADGVKCLTCGEILIDRYELPVAHTGEWVYDSHARYNADGKRHTTCTLCGEYVEERIPAKGSAGFEFFLLPDGTYRVRGGKAIEYNGVVYVPEMHEGRPVTEIGGLGKYDERINAIYIPRTVKRLNFDDMYAYKDIENYYIDPENPYFSSIDGNIYSSDKSLIKYAPGKTDKTFAVPDGVISVGERAFGNQKYIEEIVLPEGLTAIHANAFERCYRLWRINLPSTLGLLGEDAFDACYSLLLVLDKSDEGLGKSIDTGESGGYGFDVVDDEADFSLKTVGDFLFYEGPSGVYMLDHSGNDKSVILPEYGGDTQYIIYDHAFRGNDTMVSIDLGEHVTGVGRYALAYCTSLENVSFGKSFADIYDRAFEGCTALRGIELVEGMTDIGYYAFANCTALEYVGLPSSLKNIRGGAFSRCSSLEEITLNDGLECIGSGAFCDCESLSELIIPESVTLLGDSVLACCESLKSVRLPSTLERIPGSAFEECMMLESIELPRSVTEIGDRAFKWCLSLKEISLHEGTESIGNNAFSSSGLVSIELPSSLRELGEGAFYCCKSLERAVISEGLTSIPDSVFCGSALKELVLPRSIKEIRISALSGTQYLSALTYRGTMKEWENVGIWGFYHESLTYELTVICTDGEVEFEKQ